MPDKAHNLLSGKYEIVDSQAIGKHVNGRQEQLRVGNIMGIPVTDTYRDGASSLAPLFFVLCMFLLFLCCFLLRYKEAGLPRVMIQKPDGLFGYLGYYGTAFRLLRCSGLKTVSDSIVFHGSTSIVSFVIPVATRRVTRDPG
jgi:hypothetical protein